MPKLAKAKTVNNSTNSSDRTNNGTTESWKAVANRLKKMTCSCIEEFYLNEDIPKTTFYRAIEKYDFMKEAHQYALERLGVNKQKLCEERNLGMNSVMANQLPQYLDRWKKDLEWRHNLKNDKDLTDKLIAIDYILNRKDKGENELV